MNSNQVVEILDLQHIDGAMADLAGAASFPSVSSATASFARLAPVVTEAISTAGRLPAVARELLIAGRALTWVERASPEVLLKNENPSLGQDLVSLVFGATAPELVSTIAANEKLTEVNAAIFLDVVAAAALAVIVGRPDDRLTAENLAAKLEAGASDALLAASVDADESVSESVEPVVVDDPAGDDAAATEPPAAPAKLAVAPDGPTSADRPDDEPKKKRSVLMAAAAAVLAVAGIGFILLSGGSEDAPVSEPIAAAFDTEVTDPPDSVDETADAAPVAPEPDGEPSDVEPVVQPVDDSIMLSVPMLDITNPERDASGVLNFNFDTVTGEVCYSVESSNIEGPYRSHIHVGGYGVKGGIVVDLGLLESGEIGCVENLPIDTDAILSDRANHYAELHDVSEEWTIRGQLSETIDGDIVSLSVPMVNNQGISPDAEGVLNFDFDTVTGEICYSVESSDIEGPYRSHIHVGDAGVDGGIVVDLGPLVSGDVGCVANLPTDTNAILANKSGHYAELHDVSEEWTIRGQLSETVVASDSAVVPSSVDAAGGGALILLESGTVFLEGAVPDQATADDLFDSLAGIDDSTPVVNNLTVEADAPLPSGRVVIADAVFFDVASAEVKAIDEATLSAIVALALSQEDWILTVVGHTDSRGSDVENLELSLARATSLRDLLAQQGVPDENLRIRGAGETAPIGDNSTEAGRAENRRIEFEFTPKS